MVQGRESVGIQLALAQPEVVRVTIKGAKQAKGYADREHLYKATRFLPTPKGSTTTINMGQPQEQGAPELTDGDGDTPLQEADPFLMEAAKVMNAGRALPAPAADVIDADIIKEEI